MLFFDLNLGRNAISFVLILKFVCLNAYHRYACDVVRSVPFPFLGRS